MLTALVSILVGSLVGWAGSLLARTATSEGIALDIGAGAAGALIATLLLGRNSILDTLTASYVGGLLFLLILRAARRLQSRSGPAA